MVKRKIDWKVYIIAGIITLVIFLGGLGIGFLMSNEKYQIISSDLQELQIEQRDIELELLLLSSIGTQTCDTLRYEIDKTASLATDLGEKVSKYDTDVLKDVNFNILKKNYIITLIQFWSYWEIFKENCNSSVNTILYFYAIEDCTDCEAQGHVLSFLKQRYPQELMVFALDMNEELYSLNLLKNIYNVTKAPTLIVNNEKYENLIDSKELESLLVL